MNTVRRKAMQIKQIGTVYTDFDDKFGLPRQGGRIEGLTGRIVMEKEFRHPDEFNELEGYSHIWVLWHFDRAETEGFRATARPPRLGGNKAVGIFACRSPFRPNHIAMSVVKLLGIDYEAEDGPVLLIGGIDMLNKTPVLDIKPYIPADRVESPVCGYADMTDTEKTTVIADDILFENVPEEDKPVIIALLKEDPTPRYIDDEERIFGFRYKNYEIKFRKKERCISLVSIEILK